MKYKMFYNTFATFVSSGQYIYFYETIAYNINKHHSNHNSRTLTITFDPGFGFFEEAAMEDSSASFSRWALRLLTGVNFATFVSFTVLPSMSYFHLNRYIVH